MGMFVVTGAVTQCSFGIAPSTLMVLPANRVLVSNMPAANIMDNKPMVNVISFSMCQSMANPTVATATAAAQGVLTPMPCIPNTVAPWTPGNPKTLIANMPAITDSSKLTCLWGGMISINVTGQFTAQT